MIEIKAFSGLGRLCKWVWKMTLPVRDCWDQKYNRSNEQGPYPKPASRHRFACGPCSTYTQIFESAVFSYDVAWLHMLKLQPLCPTRPALHASQRQDRIRRLRHLRRIAKARLAAARSEQRLAVLRQGFGRADGRLSPMARRESQDGGGPK